MTLKENDTTCDYSNVPEVTYCIDVSCDLRVKLYLKIQCPYPNDSEMEGTRSSLVSPWLLASCLILLKDQKNKMRSWRNSIAYPPETYPTYWYNMIPVALELRYIQDIEQWDDIP